MTNTAQDLEEWAGMGLLGVDTQVYDLTQVTPFLDEMIEAARESDAPAFAGGQLPAEDAIFILDGPQGQKTTVGLHLHREGERGVRCNLMSIRAHNLVTGMMLESAGHAAKMLATNSLPKHLQPTVDFLNANGWMDPSRPENRIYSDEVFEIGAPIRCADDMADAMIRMASAACEFMAMPIASRSPGALPRPARRRLEKTGKQVRLTNVTVTRSVAAGLTRSGGHGEGGGRALHFVSGHWRISPTSIHAQPVHGQMKIWIDGFWKGNPEYGVVLHRYLARKRSAA